MNLSEIKGILAAGDIQLTKALGQNFLHDANQLRRIVAAAELGPSDKILEIGPGLGPLTELLLESAGEVLAIEKDARLVQVLSERFSRERNAPGCVPCATGGAQKPPITLLRLLHEDALLYIRREQRDWSDWKLVANLPYSVASPILVELAKGECGPQRMVVTLQLEVARRMMARAGEEEYGVLTLLVQLDYEPLNWFRIPASCFFPEPDVDSACVCLGRRGERWLSPVQRALYAKIVKRAFSQRRKMMLKLLKVDWSPERLDQAFAKLAIPPQARAETVALNQFVGLTLELGSELE